MGWWWSSNSNSNSQTNEPATKLSREEQADAELKAFLSELQNPVSKTSEPTPDPVPIGPQPPSSTRNVTEKQAAKLSRDEKADAELKAFLSELQASVTPDSSASSSSEPQKPSIFPTTMNCRQAFDEAFYCQSLGGQFNNIYRYGTLRSCSEHWSDFWFCMRTKSYGDVAKAKVVSERYRQKEAKYRSGPSSEDVWEERKPGEELKNPFSKDPDAIEIPGLPKRRKQQVLGET